MKDAKQQPTAVSRYLAEIRGIPALSPEDEEHLLAEVQRGDREALNRLVESNLGFVVKVANEYRSLGLPLGDLLNEGNLGLIEAAHRFNPDKGAKFITYAIWWVRKRILQALSDKRSLVRVPSYQRKRIREIRATEELLRGTLGREPTREEVARHLSMSPRTVELLTQLAWEEESLDQPVADHPVPLGHLIKALGVNAEQSMIRAETLAEATEALERLTRQQRTVLALRLGLAGHAPMTLRQIGACLDLSRERVRQVEKQAKAKLREMLTGKFLTRAADKPPHPPVRMATRDET